jgi:hypothetical protein
MHYYHAYILVATAVLPLQLYRPYLYLADERTYMYLADERTYLADERTYLADGCTGRYR